MSREVSILAVTFACYFAAVLAIGWYAYRRTATIADFVLGGRGLGGGVAALSASASDLLYTAVGGFLAVSWTDVLQGLLMTAALVAVPIFAAAQLGGVGPAAASVAAAHPHLLDPFTAGDGSPLGALAVIALAAWGLGYFGQPHILARFQRIRCVADRPDPGVRAAFDSALARLAESGRS